VYCFSRQKNIAYCLENVSMMGCNRILQLLNIDDRQTCEEEDATSRKIAAHIRTCSHCHYGLVRLSTDLLSNDILSCEWCRTCFADYYEATHPTYPLVKMPASQIAAVVRHLIGCPSCYEEYEELVFLAKLEESGELL